MIIHHIHRFLPSILFSSLLFSLPLKEDEIKNFIDARYSGDTATVYSMISDKFIYKHTPYVGLGIESHYVDGSLLVTHVVDDSLQSSLSVGDRIHEHNGSIVTSKGLVTTGPVGEEQHLIVTKAGDSTFTELILPLSEYQYRQNDIAFLGAILKYSDNWYNFDVMINDIIIKRNKIVVHYKWEGSKAEGGNVYYFSAMEIFYIDKKTDLIDKIEGLWSEKQFRDQFE